MSAQPETRRRETLEERVERLDVKQRDCRSCSMFKPSPTGLGFGWCDAHEQYVKLYHGAFFSQCQFKTLARARDDVDRVSLLAPAAPAGRSGGPPTAGDGTKLTRP